MTDALSLDQVRRVAQLAKLPLSDEEAVRFRDELARILVFMKELDAVDVATVGNEPEGRSPLRRDEPTPSDAKREALLGGAPKLVQEGFAVPKVLER
ncbi:MAG: Asp-tRNA(Asn)/Glu-tRNA(Gln) amidotransferase subunit GatC [Myxococcota bacterium]